MSSFNEINIDELVSSKAKIILRCPFSKCNARIIGFSDKLYQNLIVVENAPQMMGISKESEVHTGRFYTIDDVWDFDNMAVSRATDTLSEPTIKENGEEVKFKIERILICSECDRGPLGFAGYKGDAPSDVKNLLYFLSGESVLYDVKA